MRHVICKLQNASENISGVEFVRQDDGSVMTAEPMEDAVAEATFGGIAGYELFDPDAPPADAPKRTRMSAAEKAAKAAAEAGVVAPEAVIETVPAAAAPAAEAPAA